MNWEWTTKWSWTVVRWIRCRNGISKPRSSGSRYLLAYRPSSEVGGGLGLGGLPHFDEIALAELDHENAARLIRSKLAQMLGADAAPPAFLVDLITTRAQGNPFYIEELLNFIRSQGVNPQDESALSTLELPESLHSLILSRIDKLAEAPRRTLKVASVLGRVFKAPMLPGVYPELGAFEQIQEHLRTLGASDLVNVDLAAEQSYVFKHVVTQEVAYESMPFAIRSMLHERVGRHIEATERDAIDRHLDLLAHHYWRSETCRRSASTWRAPAMRHRRPTRTRRRSTISSACPRSSSRGGVSTRC